MKSFLDHKKHLDEEKERIAPLNEKPDEISWKRWRQLTNLSTKELKEYFDSPEGKEVREKSSVEVLLQMMESGETFEKAQTTWTPDMWRACRKNSSSITRNRTMRKRMVGNPFERDGKKTRWLKSLLAMGHDPQKSMKSI